MALKDLIASKAALTEDAIETIVSKYVLYDVDSKEVALTPAGTGLAAKAKLLVYLAALQGWRFLVKEEVNTDASPTELEQHLGLPGGTIRPMLRDLSDRHLLVAKSGRYSVRASHFAAIKTELEGVGSARKVTRRASKQAKTAKEDNSRSPIQRRRNFNGGKTGSLTAKFEGWIDAGFFDEPRSLADLGKKFRQAGIIMPPTSIPQFVLRAVRKNRLSREEAEVNGKNVWVYTRAV
jgi:hypothetical protein